MQQRAEPAQAPQTLKSAAHMQLNTTKDEQHDHWWC